MNLPLKSLMPVKKATKTTKPKVQLDAFGNAQGLRNSLGCKLLWGIDLAVDQAAIWSSERMAA
jgi:hypothetical protein